MRRAPIVLGDDDYTRKYPNDDYGAEMGPDARIWKTYIDERDVADKEYISDNNATLDGILVFVSCYRLLESILNCMPFYSVAGVHLLCYRLDIRDSDIPVPSTRLSSRTSC